MALHLKSTGIDYTDFGDEAESSELMDDYEEGTWTVAFTGDTGSWAVHGGVDQGAYTKIGRFVCIQGQWNVNGSSSPTGTFWMNMPYTNTALTEAADYTIGSVKMSDFNWDSGNDHHHIYIETYGGSAQARGGASGDNMGTQHWQDESNGYLAIWLGYCSE